MITKLTKARREELKQMDEDYILYFIMFFNHVEVNYLAKLGSPIAQEYKSQFKPQK